MGEVQTKYSYINNWMGKLKYIALDYINLFYNI